MNTKVKSRKDDLQRIKQALLLAYSVVERTDLRTVNWVYKSHGDAVTSLDCDINTMLRRMLPSGGEGWLSEETKDDLNRLKARRVWIVDPIDGTRELLQRIPEWCVSIALIEAVTVVAGGILNPSTGEMFLGSADAGLQLSNIRGEQKVRPSTASVSVLVSRNEYVTGKWMTRDHSAYNLLPMGSVAYRLARVAAGYAVATCSFEPRFEWDVAAGVALVEAAGGTITTIEGRPLRFNSADPRIPSIIASSSTCENDIVGLLTAGRRLNPPKC